MVKLSTSKWCRLEHSNFISLFICPSNSVLRQSLMWKGFPLLWEHYLHEKIWEFSEGAKTCDPKEKGCRLVHKGGDGAWETIYMRALYPQACLWSFSLMEGEKFTPGWRVTTVSPHPSLNHSNFQTWMLWWLLLFRNLQDKLLSFLFCVRENPGTPLGDALQKDVLAGGVMGGQESQPNSWKWQGRLESYM